ncbi:hypothetical protein CRM94_16600 [Burkholderia gladioli]|uniref:Uncharacterized protein n=1 Tax=Burkholderia gladioli TaxID=28095 RepID=A0A2A7SB32_BURGA|nr:hypothetical protein CO712_35500 [Burkholderia gladioli pv. gladioli]PEH40619.1 hypothetical protein CRM94_16600 [Burkholderia gladioli]
MLTVVEEIVQTRAEAIELIYPDSWWYVWCLDRDVSYSGGRQAFHPLGIQNDKADLFPRVIKSMKFGKQVAAHAWRRHIRDLFYDPREAHQAISPNSVFAA